MVYVRPDEARCRGARYPCNAPGIAVRIPAISAMAARFLFSFPTWPKRTLEQKRFPPPRMPRASIWPKRTLE
jgi:hypothetical protein